MDIQSFLVEGVLIFVPALWFISIILRQTPKVPDWIIPYILILLGVTGTLFLLRDMEIPLRIIQGVLVAAVAILGNAAAKGIALSTSRDIKKRKGGNKE